jgi:hypothetical protein
MVTAINSINLTVILDSNGQDEHVAHCLEMDLQGHGTTGREALRELHDLVTTQIDFALFKSEPGLVWHPDYKEDMAESIKFLLDVPVENEWLPGPAPPGTFKEDTAAVPFEEIE